MFRILMTFVTVQNQTLKNWVGSAIYVAVTEQE